MAQPFRRTPLERRRRSLKGPLLALALLLLLVAAGFEWSSRRLLRKAGGAALAGEVERAAELFERVSRRPLHRGDALEGLAVIELLGGRLERGQRELERARAAGARLSAYPERELLERWLRQGDYQALAAYGRVLFERDPEDLDLRLHLGFAEHGVGNIERAHELLASGRMQVAADAVGRGREHLLGPPFRTPELREAYRRHLELLGQEQRERRRPLVRDRAGRVLAWLRLDGDQARPEPATPAAELLLEGADGAGGLFATLTSKDLLNGVTTTLDLGLQRQVMELIRGRSAAVVVLDRDGRVLVAAGAAARGDELPAPEPLDEAVPLASVLKLATYAEALESGHLQTPFPYDCSGPIRVGGRPLYDWLAHGQLANAREALALSCNLSFAQLGLASGGEGLLDVLRRLGFGRAPEPGLPAIGWGPLPSGLEDQRELALAAAGNIPLAAPLPHAAALALSVAREGLFARPYLVERLSTLGGFDYLRQQPEGWRALEAGVARELGEAMRRVVEHPDGTGKRLSDLPVLVAAKTGTWGSRRTRLDGLVVGFVPADDVQFAFAVWIRGGGMASAQPALLARALVELLTGPVR